jgi:hypothetical protein
LPRIDETFQKNEKHSKTNTFFRFETMPPRPTAVGSVPEPQLSVADEMIPAEPPRPLAVPVSALLPATATGGSIPAGLRMLSEAGE